MLRFGTPAAHRSSRSLSHERWRLWLLFAAACIVVVAIRMLGEPTTARRVDRLFSPGDESSDSPTTIEEVLGGESHDVEFGLAAAPAPSQGDVPQGQPVPPQGTRFDLSAVRDNTYFRPEENAAWFEVFDWLKSEPRELTGDSRADVSYAQFIDQPEVYRGKVVAVSGTVERVEVLDAPTNDVGIEQYTRLILRPAGGGVWPIVVYSLELPANFPRDDNANAEVRVRGVFFKNWSYSWQGGLGLAPVVLAKSVEWHPPVAVKRPRAQVSVTGLIAALVAAGALAAVVGWLAWRNSRRPSAVLAGHRVIAPPPEDT